MKGKVLIIIFASMLIMVGMTTDAWSKIGNRELTNPGFESGNFYGWTVDIFSDGSANVVKSHTNYYGDITYKPKFGKFFAVLETGVEVKCSQSVNLRGGDELRGWAAFDASWVALPSSNYAQVTVYNQGKNIFDVVWYSDVEDVGSHGSGSWTKWKWVAPIRGIYTLEYRVGTLSGGDCYGLFDAWAFPKPIRR